MKNMLEIKLGKCVSIVKVSAEAPIKIRRRSLDFGFTKGQRLRTLFKSTLGKDYIVVGASLAGVTLVGGSIAVGLIIARRRKRLV